MKVHILDDWFDTLKTLPSFRLLDGHDVTVWTDHVEDVDVLADRLAEAEALVLFRERTAITGPLLARLPKLKLISQRSVYPHVDVPACTRHGVLLSSNMQADAPSYAAAELTFALLLAAARQLPAQITSLKAGTWQCGVGKSLRGRTLGLYGYGRIGKAVAGYARAFGMVVQWWGSEDGRARAAAAEESVAPSREAFFATSDAVSVHVRLKPETKGLITLDDLLAMQPGAIFVNTSRSALVAPGALLAALDAGRPGTVAVDVFDKEPLTDPRDPLLTHPRVIATPHIGFVTEDELDGQFADIYAQINAYAAGAPIHMINPDAFGAR
ncbi:D-2-hydroxyacid dehydrogenase family protein [Polymorphum gilvum]|uniref:D-isomer specific 2-hydroxyacid dehydrogenase, NAD-binding protein n=1 Tax=Polymorphum gilvum (strain LMG 25793 / CGMCC 1.9160 / SL003B-26A1) TaxID=991905 RepID=F2J3Z6_POLGS|nr:D-2-hydroxyacid dehydrogenase family protein [Polymorphum gilvum]ADZ68978.1 D-isomer specific 2-hydroxyacid dehydrogenase, NAD-binding protein [Polymorphum gilvum SL003B-26A1]